MDGFERSLQTFHGGRRIPWGLGLMQTLCASLKNGGQYDPVGTLLACAVNLQPAIHQLLSGLPSRKMQLNGLHALRVMLGGDDRTRPLVALLPRFLRRERADPMRRQRHLVVSECLPKGLHVPWCLDLFRAIIDRKRGHWRTSAGARQELSMLHKFLRSTGWLDLPGIQDLAGFRCHVDTHVSDEELCGICERFLSQLRSTDACSKGCRLKLIREMA